MRITCVVVTAAVLTLAGCSEGTRESAAKPSTSPTSAVTTRSPTPPPVVDYGRAKLVTGTEAWGLDEGTVSTDADGTVHSRRGTVQSTFTCADPRVAGSYVATWNSDRWSGGDALVQWGTGRLTNAGGAWIGRMTGSYTSETHDVITIWFTGTGKYAGLSMYLWETPGYTAFEFPFTALIFPGTPPPA